MKAPRSVMLWLVLLLVTMLALVAVGGITRLTGSGLSMVKWEPLLGVIPPRSQADWEERFAQYQAYPEYQLLNQGMSLEEFKRIFFWEYLHRLLGRLVGLMFLVPFLFFLARGRVRGKLALRLAFAFVLGGLQGALGWYMVRSGLAEDPSVSHYRLAAHLALAFFLFAYLLWMLLDLRFGDNAGRGRRDNPARGHPLRGWALGLLALLSLQIVYGAFVAGLNAGYMFNTFPKMLGRWIPPGLIAFEPAWTNLVRNATAVQFIHRWLGALLVVAVAVFWLRARRGSLSALQGFAVDLVAFFTILQFFLGVLTLLLVVPLPAAVLHQIMACLLLGATVFAVHAFSPSM